MTGANKISIVSTISYGAFSCTLEGFDDPSGTVNAIVEYFQDLAADGDYPGAEHRMPDIDMLAQIAGHEIGQQIEVDVRDNSVVLRLLKQTIAVAGLDTSTEEYGDAQDKTVSVALDDTDIQKDVQYALGEPNLSTEDKVDLVTKLADMELEGITFEDDPDLDLGIGKALRLDRASRTLHETSDAEDEAAMARLMDKANEQLETTESTRRHSAFSHLRAAMAATVADRTFKPKTYDDTFGDADEAKAYRIDLADAVPPLQRQEGKDSNRTDQPVPSVLPSEQPLDQDEAKAQEQPAAPEAFITPELPAAPEPITAPEEPAAPEQSVIPEEPLTLEQPAVPEAFVTPEQPAAPEPIAAPEEPVAPEEPLTLEQPAAPEAFVTPEEPAAPEPIAAPEQSFMPEEPLALEQPVAPEAFVTPEEPAEPEQSAAPEQPLMLEQPLVTPEPNEGVKESVTFLREVKSDQDDVRSPDARKIDTSGMSFADFSRTMNATELQDLLEAAAAYITYIEGQTHFARPQIMRLVASIAGMKNFGREEGLLAFGQLLRQNKIARATPGQFKIADTTRFKP